MKEHDEARRRDEVTLAEGDLEGTTLASQDVPSDLRHGDTPGLAKIVAGGAGWLGAARMLSQATQFGVGLILARLLSPEDFGLVASVTVIVGFAVLVVEGGLTSAIVHQRNPSARDYSTVFWLNLLGGILLAATVWQLSPAIAQFYGQPELVDVAPIVGLTFACSTAVVHSALLRRQLRFKTGALIEGLSTVAGLGITLLLAAMGVGAIALAIGPVCAQVLASLAYTAAVPWRPRHFISLASVRRLARFAGPLLGATVADYWGRNADSLLIGRAFGPSSLGYYNRAYNLMLLPIGQITGAVGNAVSPALASMRDDNPRARSAYRKSFQTLALLTMPMLIGLAATAEGLVPLLWGQNWSESVPLLEILSIAGIPYCLSVTAAWLFQAQERTGTMFRVSLLWTAIAIIGMVIGLRWGAEGVAIALLVRYWIGLPFELRAATRTFGLSLKTLTGDAVALLTPALAMGAVVWSLPIAAGLSRTTVLTVGIQVTVGVLLQAAFTLIFNRRLLTEVVELIR